MVVIRTKKVSLRRLKALKQRQKKERQEMVVNEDDTQNHEIEPHPQEDEWVISINEKLLAAGEDDKAGSWKKVSIYKVPRYLRAPSDDMAYIPQVVSLGPYHNGKEWLKPMERHKWRALYHILARTDQNIKLYLETMKKLEDDARACYEGPLKLSSDQFVEMMLLDGCFILEILQGFAVTNGFKMLGYATDDPIFSVQGTTHSIQRDMILLENQIPLFVLENLIGLQPKTSDGKADAAELAIAFFNPLMPEDEKMRKVIHKQKTNNLSVNADQRQLTTSSTTDLPLSVQGGLHFLDVIRRSYFYRGDEKDPTDPLVGESERCQELIHSVTELKDAGLKIKKRKTDKLWDIEFENGTLYIPQILIHDGTKSFFQNLIAFEQCHLDCKKDITSYVVFLDNLIDTAEDVRCLHYHGIIEHWLGSDDEVANLVNCLGKEVVFDINDSYLSNLSKKINKYYNRKWNTWRATLNERYFNSPWAIISLVAAVFLLILTAAQTFYGAYSYYRPNN